MKRKLASIQRVLELAPILGADAIDVATVLGWKLVVKKGEFKVGDLGVFFEVDSLLPERPDFEFLRPKRFRIKTVRLRGQLSQGILFPCSILPPGTTVEEGQDVSELLGVVKYEPPVPAHLGGLVRGPFPGFLHKTDEPRIQSHPGLLSEFQGLLCYITEKIDGTSATFANKDGDIHVCSRNLSLKETEGNTYWQVFRKYKLEEKLKLIGNYAIQGEIAGPGIQKNPLGLKEAQLFVFNIFDIDLGEFLHLEDMEGLCQDLGLQMVPILARNEKFHWALPELLEMAKGQYPSGKPREGIVIRPVEPGYSPTLSCRLSFKVLNNDFLLKEE